MAHVEPGQQGRADPPQLPPLGVHMAIASEPPSGGGVTVPESQQRVDDWPQLSRQLPLQVPFGVQHWVPSQTSPAAQLFAGHERVPPQLSESVVLQFAPQVANEQHESSAMHFWPVGQAVDPPPPQLTV